MISLTVLLSLIIIKVLIILIIDQLDQIRQHTVDNDIPAAAKSISILKKIVESVNPKTIDQILKVLSEPQRLNFLEYNKP